MLNGECKDKGGTEPDIEQRTIEDDMIDSVMTSAACGKSDILDQPEIGIDLTDIDEDARPSVGWSTTDDIYQWKQRSKKLWNCMMFQERKPKCPQ